MRQSGTSLVSWKALELIAKSALWYAFGAFDIISDIYSISVVMMVSKDLNLRTDSKIKLLVILGSRFLFVHRPHASF